MLPGGGKQEDKTHLLLFGPGFEGVIKCKLGGQEPQVAAPPVGN
jgi:hypothetical protein